MVLIGQGASVVEPMSVVLEVEVRPSVVPVVPDVPVVPVDGGFACLSI